MNSRANGRRAPLLENLKFTETYSGYRRPRRYVSTLNRPNGKRLDIIKEGDVLQLARVFAPDPGGVGQWKDFSLGGCPLTTQTLIIAFHKDEL